METDENSERQRQVSLFRAGDKDLLETIYGKFLHSFIYLYVITCNCQIEDARDAFSKAVEETYIKIISDMDFILTSSLETYIFRVARNKLINIIKSKLRLEKLENNLNDIIADVKSLENIEENNFRKKYVQNMLKILSPRDRKIIELRYFEHLHWADIATIMELDEGYLRNLNLKILCTLKEIFEDRINFDDLGLW